MPLCTTHLPGKFAIWSIKKSRREKTAGSNEKVSYTSVRNYILENSNMHKQYTKRRVTMTSVRRDSRMKEPARYNVERVLTLLTFFSHLPLFSTLVTISYEIRAIDNVRATIFDTSRKKHSRSTSPVPSNNLSPVPNVTSRPSYWTFQ